MTLFSIRVYAQNSTNYIQVLTNGSLTFNIDGADDLESVQTKYNAITLRVASKARACNVYARVSNYSVPSGFIPSDSPIKLDYTSTTSPTVTYVYSSPLELSLYDQLLFSENKNGSLYNFNYNLMVGPLDYSYVPGNYSFTILFTMVQP